MIVAINVGRYRIGRLPELPNPVYGGRWKSDKVSGVPIFNGVQNPNWTQLPRYLESPNRNLNLEDYDQHAALQMSRDSSAFRRDFDEIYAMAKRDGEISLLCHCAPDRCHLDNVAISLAERLRADGYEPVLEERLAKRGDLSVRTVAAMRCAYGIERAETLPLGGVRLMPAGSDMFSSAARAFVNPVNCVGVMGKGVALEFKRRFPEILPAYEFACREGVLSAGGVMSVPLRVEGGSFAMLAATKDHYASPSRPEWIVACAKNLRAEAERLEIRSVSCPLIGGGLGGVEAGFVFRALRDGFAGSNVSLELHVGPEHHASISRVIARDALRRGESVASVLTAEAREVTDDLEIGRS